MAEISATEHLEKPRKRARQADGVRKPPTHEKTAMLQDNIEPEVLHRSAHRYHDAAGYRCVHPYVHTFSCFVKRRWIGRALLEIFTTEFGSHPPEYFERAINAGTITVDGNHVPGSYLLRDGDLILHRVHRHEPRVPGAPITLLYEDDYFFVVDKPGGIPVHACGPYHFNSLGSLVCAELGRGFWPALHRLDRLTSGLVVMGKKPGGAAANFLKDMADGHVKKRYLARARGVFPTAPRCEGMREHVDAGAVEFRLRPDGLRVAAAVPLKRISTATLTEARSSCPFLRSFRPQISDANLAAAATAGDEDAALVDAAPDAGELGTGTDDRANWTNEGWLHVSVGIVGLDARNAKHGAAAADGSTSGETAVKESVTLFKRICTNGRESIVECRPLTGRTHQLRVHLAWLGFPISNDPKYNPEAHAALEAADAAAIHAEQTARAVHEAAATASAAVGAAAAADGGEIKASADDALLRSLCTACTEGERKEFNVMQRICHGIFLHSVQYDTATLSWSATVPAWTTLDAAVPATATASTEL